MKVTIMTVIISKNIDNRRNSIFFYIIHRIVELYQLHKLKSNIYSCIDKIRFSFFPLAKILVLEV